MGQEPDELALLEQVVSSVDELCGLLGDDDWGRATDCPAWSVKDILSHLASYESVATGMAPAPEIDLSRRPHVKPGDDFARANEREVETRRGQTPEQVLQEYREATMARLKHLRGLGAAEWETDQTVLPFATVPTKQLLGMRVLDFFYHEQDMRRATGNPGHLDGAVARFAFERMAVRAFPMVVAKNAGAPEGTVVRWAVPPPGHDVTVRVSSGRGEVVDALPDPTVSFASDLETLLCLFGGRWTPERARAEGRLTVEGDPDLAESILRALVVIP